MSPIIKKLESTQDKSINLVHNKEGRLFESRLVQRSDQYFSVYLSSAAGCRQACRHCHLTATKQVDDTPANLTDFVIQAVEVLKLAPENVPKVHFNFMARGEPLLNPIITSVSGFDNLKRILRSMAEALNPNIEVKFNISTIMPLVNNTPLLSLAADDTEVYYSLYSANAEFRRRFLPKAAPYYTALAVLDSLGANFRLHYALLDGLNDSDKDAEEILSALKKMNMSPKLNLVRYNPPTDETKESTRYEEYAAHFKDVKIIPRVGFDVYASCGMFYR